MGRKTKMGISAKVFPKKYTSVRYIPFLCSRRKIGSSVENTYKTHIYSSEVVDH